LRPYRQVAKNQRSMIITHPNPDIEKVDGAGHTELERIF